MQSSEGIAMTAQDYMTFQSMTHYKNFYIETRDNKFVVIPKKNKKMDQYEDGVVIYTCDTAEEAIAFIEGYEARILYYNYA
jgi:ABC-type sugar transport system ATPase subunit